MTIKTFRGRNLEEARKTAERELGGDVVVVATRTIRKPAVFGLFSSQEIEISVTASATDESAKKPRSPFADAAHGAVEDPRADIERIRAEVRNEVRTLRALFARSQQREERSDPIFRELEAELFELHEMVSDLRNDQDREPPAQLKRILTSTGVDGGAARIISRRVKERGDGEAIAESVRAVLLDLIKTGEFPLASKKRTLIGLVGPTGVGKTTTAAKLAAYAILEQRRTVTLVSCDSYRVGAVEQLERFASILGAEFCAVKTRHALEEVIAAAKTDVVIIDTAGRPSGRDDIETSLGRLGSGGEFDVRHVLLCLPAALRETDARRTVRLFSQVRPTSLVITKLDETQSPSGLVHGPIAAKLPIAALCFGQRVPEDISRADARAILDALLPARKSAAGAAVVS